MKWCRNHQKSTLYHINYVFKANACPRVQNENMFVHTSLSYTPV